MKSITSKDDEKKLRDCLSRIQAALAGLSEAESERGRVLRKINETENDLIVRLSGLDPLDDESLDEISIRRSRMNEMRSWLTNGAPVRNALNRVHVELNTAKTLIHAHAQHRSSAEAAIGMCNWWNCLAVLPSQNIQNATQTIRECVAHATNDLFALLQQRLPVALTIEERNNGILKSGAVTVRRLTPAEIQTGFANA